MVTLPEEVVADDDSRSIAVVVVATDEVAVATDEVDDWFRSQ